MAIHPQFRSSATPGAAPDVADMLKHEVAINTADAKLFAKDVNDVLQEYSITGETITRFVISQADATANPAQVGERIRIVATSETISLPFPQDPVQGQTITIITHQDSDAGFFAELSSTGIPFRVEDTESTAPHVLRFSVDDNGTETAVDGEYVLTFTGAFWTLDNPVSLSLVPNALHWRSGNADFYAGELAAGRSVTVLADDGHLYKLSTDRTVYLGEVADGVVRNNLTPEHIDSVVWTVSVNRNDRWNGTAWAPHPGAQGSPDPIPGIPSVDPSALANTARGEHADWIRLDSRVEYVRGATYENLLVKSDDSVSSKIIDDLSTGRRKVGDIISIESFFRASDYADGLPHGFNKAVIVDGQHGTLSDTLFAVGDYRLKLLFDDDIYRATQLGAKDDLADYSSFLRNLTENVAAGKTLVFDDFTYHITALKIFSNTTVKNSNGGSFRCIDGTGVDSGSNYYLLYNLGESGVVYDSIVVDGNKANNSAFNLFDAITCVGDKSKVINCKVTNAADSGIFIGDGANMYAGNNEIEGATDAGIYANRNTVHTGEYSVTIENNQIHDCTEAGIAVKRVAQKVNVNTNTVTGTCDVGISLTKAGDVSAFGILGKSSINGNTVDTAGGLCVAVHNSKHVSVANNVLSLTGTTSDPAIVDIGGSKAVSVSGNMIAGDKQTNGATQIKGILIRDRERNAGDTDPANNDISEGVTISSNAISDCDVAHNILIMPGGNVSKNIKYRGNVIIDCNAEFLASPGVDTVLTESSFSVSAVAIADTDVYDLQGCTLRADTSLNGNNPEEYKYKWVQITGTSVSLKYADRPECYFYAPDVAEDERLTFRLTVTRKWNGFNLEDHDDCIVNVVKFTGQLFDPADYGAVTDNITDCRAAINAAVNAAEAVDGGVVLSTSGTYYVSNLVVINQGCKWFGPRQSEGGSKAKLRVDTDKTAVRFVDAETGTVSGCVISDVEFVPPAASTRHAAVVHGIRMEGASKVTCQRLSFDYAPYYAVSIRLTAASAGASDGCRFYQVATTNGTNDFGEMISLKADSVSADDSEVQWINTKTVPVPTNEITDIHIIDCNIHGGDYGMGFTHLSHSVIANNTTDKNTRNMSLQATCHHVVIRNNENNNNYSSSIHLAFGAHDCLVSGNAIDTVDAVGEGCIQALSGSTDNVIEYNDIYAHSGAEPRWMLFTGFESHRNVFRYNTLRGSVERAYIAIQPAMDSAVTGTTNWGDKSPLQIAADTANATNYVDSYATSDMEGVVMTDNVINPDVPILDTDTGIKGIHVLRKVISDGNTIKLVKSDVGNNVVDSDRSYRNYIYEDA